MYDQVVSNRGTKYMQIYRSLKEAIDSGTYAPGCRLPSEHELVQMYGASRVTVCRALSELKSDGRIERRVGSGTYVTAGASKGYKFGLIIPDLGQTEIFEPICQAMMATQQVQKHVLIWGQSLAGSDATESQAREVCLKLVADKVSGVFFAPFESNPRSDAINRAIAGFLSDSKVPTVLLDRDIVDYPQRSSFDVVGIDNRRAGCVATQHLIRSGCRRIGFIGHPHLAPSCTARSNGYRDAIVGGDLEAHSEFVERLDPSDRLRVAAVMQSYRPDGLVCSNDRTAAELMKTLNELGIAVPDQVRIVAFDDVKYAHLVSVPLTTIRQPCDQLGAAAVRAIVERIQDPDMPARDILVDFCLVIRESCGAAAVAAGAGMRHRALALQ